MLDKLKPCPFCGEKAEVSYGYNIDFNNRSHRFFFAICIGCGARGSNGETETEAADKWNRWYNYAEQALKERE